jgi:hypothetical protein
MSCLVRALKSALLKRNRPQEDSKAKKKTAHGQPLLSDRLQKFEL